MRIVKISRPPSNPQQPTTDSSSYMLNPVISDLVRLNELSPEVEKRAKASMEAVEAESHTKRPSADAQATRNAPVKRCDLALSYDRAAFFKRPTSSHENYVYGTWNELYLS